MNRKVLEWLKKWDSVLKNPELEENGSFKRVILLHGPPGSGKTTCAHIIAKHCGYNVIEVNASDDRSIKNLRKLISNVSENHSISFTRKTKKKNLMIIDEIDGIGNSAAELNKLMNEYIDFTSKKIKRPIICICNNLYANPIRIFREKALLFKFDKISKKDMRNRLNQICSLENIELDIKLLNELSEFNDIRSVLNTLQFLTSNNQKEDEIRQFITYSMYKESNIGGRDKETSAFSCLEALFLKDVLKGEKPLKFFLNKISNLPDANSKRFLFDSLHSNYLNFTRNYFNCISQLSDSFADADVLGGKMGGSNFNALTFLLCKLFNNTNRRKNYLLDLKREINDREYKIKGFFNNLEIIKTPLIKINRSDCVLYFLPLLQSIVFPSKMSLSPVQNKKRIFRITEIMIENGLKYEKSGGFLNLVPKISDLVVDCDGREREREFPFQCKSEIKRLMTEREAKKSDGFIRNKKISPKKNVLSNGNLRKKRKKKIDRNPFGREENKMKREVSESKTVYYAFKEGCTKAVRRRVGIDEFLT